MDNNLETSKLIKKHLDEQRFAVLATQADGQPYTNLVAFAEVDNLHGLLFVTSRDTRKYANTLASKKVAVLIDNRKNQASDLNNAIAITALGTVEEVAACDKDFFRGIYLAKHPQLKDFLGKPLNAIMKVIVEEYIVATFLGVRRLPIEEIK
jgi:Pyridoxamine 5'-phosphate oxidase